jgi:hypothetical protein
MIPRYRHLVRIIGTPLPVDVFQRYHYFVSEKAALRFAGRIDECECYMLALLDPPSFLKPVTRIRLQYRGKIYECRYDFPYETDSDDVAEAWIDPKALGCDCAMSDMISRCHEQGFKHMPCGHKISVVGISLSWETDKAEIDMHPF